MKKVVMVEEYDGEGKLVKRTVTTEEEIYPTIYRTTSNSNIYWTKPYIGDDITDTTVQYPRYGAE